MVRKVKTSFFLWNIVLLVMAPLTSATNGAASLPEADLQLKLETKLAELCKAGRLPGATFGFVLPDGRSGAVATGYSDVEKKIPMRPNDKMLSASIGKSYVSAIMLQLIQEGKANLSDKIDHWFGAENWFYRLPNAGDITLRMLMNHTSGIPDHIENRRFIAARRQNPERFWSPQELVMTILDAPPLFPAGKGWAYSDTNYILVGMIIEQITHAAYYDELSRRILRPLRLDDTSPSNKKVISGLISGYTDPKNPYGVPEKVCQDGKDALNPQAEWTGGGLVSTSLDTARWAKYLFGGNVLQPSSLRTMLSGVDKVDLPAHKYGLGVYIRTGEWGTSYGHGGDYYGFRSAVDYFADYDLAVAIQVNSDNFASERQMHLILDSYLDALAGIIIAQQLKKSEGPHHSTNMQSGDNGHEKASTALLEQGTVESKTRIEMDTANGGTSAPQTAPESITEKGDR